MQRRKTEKWKSEPSLLGFGVMRMPTTEDGKIDRTLSDAMLKRAYEGGVTYFDTAYTYHGGESEPYLGTFLSSYPRESFQVASKMPHWEIQSLEDAKRIFAEQLDRVGVEYFDFYLIHSIGKEAFTKVVDLGVLAFLEEQQRAGKIIHLGFSFHQVYEEFAYILRYRPWDFCQIQYNFLDTEEQAGTAGYELATELGIPVIVMEPVKGGSLMTLGDDLRKRFTDLDPTASVASYALRWVADHPNVKLILSGMSTMGHVEDNLATLSPPIPLSERERTTLEEVGQIMRERVGNSCTGCAYCVPCPFGVDIPGNFALWNKARMFDSYQMIKNAWESDEQQDKRPPACTECGVCIPLCPQMIDIPEDLKRVQDELTERRSM
ncbi:MAG: aldo/keto reductase [Spirochaetales bacterium]|nr:aldo/keto reductase [Spirochaetales bacterium]